MPKNMLFTSFAQNQSNACEDRTKIICNLLCMTVLKIPEIFVREPGKREAKKLITSREFAEPGSRFSNPNHDLSKNFRSLQGCMVVFCNLGTF